VGNTEGSQEFNLLGEKKIKEKTNVFKSRGEGGKGELKRYK